MPQPLSLREAAFFAWEACLNLPYLWAGDDPLAGVDCSGLVLEGLKSVGLVPRELDVTAHDILHVTFGRLPRLGPAQERELRRGMLVFWPTADGARIRHIEIVWAVFLLGAEPGAEFRVLTLGASGGGSRTVDRAEAIRANAFVKVRQISRGWVAAIDPFASVQSVGAAPSSRAADQPTKGVPA